MTLTRLGDSLYNPMTYLFVAFPYFAYPGKREDVMLLDICPLSLEAEIGSRMAEHKQCILDRRERTARQASTSCRESGA